MKIIEKSIEEKKKEWKDDIKKSWLLTLLKGFRCSNNIIMDTDWEAILKLKTGIEYLKSVSVDSIDVRDFENAVHTLTISDAEGMLNELIDNYYTLIKKKWNRQLDVDNTNKKVKW